MAGTLRSVPVAGRHPKVRGQVESCGRRLGTKVPKAGWPLPEQGGTSGFYNGHVQRLAGGATGWAER